MTTTPSRAEIRRAIRAKYRQAAGSTAGLFAYATGAEGARALGYDADVVARAPAEVMQSFCGVGNPLALGAVGAGEVVLDVGCGAGFDVFVASGMVGAAGKVVGVDLTPEMISGAAASLGRVGAKNVEFHEGAAEEIPCADTSMDVVVSNGVLNLSPQKDRTFAEIYRVLKPGGRLQFADIVLDDTLPQETVGNLEAWSH